MGAFGLIARYGGVTATQWRDFTKVKVKTHGREVWMKFTYPSKGGGEVDVQVELPAEEFTRVVEAMIEADPQAAIDAFAVALKRRV